MTRWLGAILTLIMLAGSGQESAHAADTIKVVVPFAAGGPVDLLARLVSADMQTRLNTEMVIENRGGGGGVIATEQVARAAPDGKTLLFASSGSHVISAALRAGQLNYDAVKSFAPVAFVGAVPMLVIVSPDYPAKNLGELIAKAKTDKLSYGSAGAGSTMHIIGELINAEAGIKTTHVPYKGVAPALNDLLGGHIQLLSADLPVLEPLVKSGKVRALALFATERSRLLPDLPTSAELGYPRMLMNNWYGMLAPAGTPAPVQAALEKAMLEAMKSPMVSQRLAAGGVVGGMDGKGFAQKLATDMAYWSAELKKLGINGE
jgi:tripartite-type tricarboxylate transporter receptor subunit TctC